MNESPIPLPIILAELLRIQRWAGGDTVSAGRIFGLMHGIESVIRQEKESFGVIEETQYSKPRAGGKKRRGRPPGRGRTAGANGALTAADLMEAKNLAEQLGGIEQARQALATLEELR